MGLKCAHPKLQTILEYFCTISFLGRIFVPFDRFLEYVNLLQQKRSTAFRGFDSQLQFSKFLKPLVHVDGAWKEADGPGTGLDDGIPEFLYNDVAELRRKLRATLGTDLSKHVTGNTLWHTGNAVPLDGGDYRERMPWVYVKMVQAGRSAGKGRSAAKCESWRVVVKGFVHEHWF